MNLAKAIEILTDFRRQESALLGDEFRDATQLLIEAGKRLEHYRSLYLGDMVNLLPGETKD